MQQLIVLLSLLLPLQVTLAAPTGNGMGAKTFSRPLQNVACWGWGCRGYYYGPPPVFYPPPIYVPPPIYAPLPPPVYVVPQPVYRWGICYDFNGRPYRCLIPMKFQSEGPSEVLSCGSKVISLACPTGFRGILSGEGAEAVLNCSAHAEGATFQAQVACPQDI